MNELPEFNLSPLSAIGPTPGGADAILVLTRLREAGHVAYLAGGCVRDLLLGRAPKDFDVATDAPPDRVRKLFRNTQAVGAAFGVILVRMGGATIEVATFRAEGPYLDGRRPSKVQFTTAQEDARRRDFTINGLFLDPIENRVIDFVNGRADVAAKVVRAIGNPDERFAEDHLRMLRAVRFASRLGFAIEPQTADAIRNHAPQLARISPERIAEELRGAWRGPGRGVAYSLLRELGLLPLFFRFHASARQPQTGDAAISVFGELPREGETTFGLTLAAAAIDQAMWHAPPGSDVRAVLAKPAPAELAQSLRQSLKISNEESAEMTGAMEGLAPLLAEKLPALAAVKRFLARPSAHLSRALLEALGRTYLPASRVQSLSAQLAELEATEFAPPPYVTGDDLTAAGFEPGPMFRRVLDDVYDAQLESRVTTRTQAMEMALGIARANKP